MMSKLRNKHVLFLTLLFGIISLSYSSRLGGGKNAFITNSFALLPPLLAAAYGFYAARTYRTSNPHGRSHTLIATGLLFWFIGEASFFLFQFIAEINPYPSIADLSFLAGYPLVWAGLVNEIKVNKSSLKDVNQFIQLLISLILIMLGLAVLYFGIFLAYIPGQPLLNNVTAMTYGLVDLILIAPTLYVLKMAVDYRGGKLFMSWGLILIGLLMKLYADVFFAIYRDQYTAIEWPFNMIDVLSAASYLLFAYSFYSTGSYVREIRSKLKA